MLKTARESSGLCSSELGTYVLHEAGLRIRGSLVALKLETRPRLVPIS